MGFLIFLLGIYMILSKDKRKSDIFKTIFGLGILMSVLSSIFRFEDLWSVVFLIGFFVLLIRKKKKSEKTQQQENEDYRQWRETTYQQTRGGSYSSNQTWEQTRTTTRTFSGSAGTNKTAAKVSSSILPRVAAKRTRIVQNFNKKFGLDLTEEEIKRIVDASYLSEAWKREVEAMTENYAIDSEWFQGPTGWLRVYLYVFHIQNVSSDFPRQLQICDETFDEVMQYAESLQYASMDEKIAKVNERFFTRFDETTFMIAYRFMELRGHKYDLDKIHILKNEADYEEAARKYDKMENGWQEEGQTGAMHETR